MKKGIFFLLVITATSASAQQSLKDALYGGKLKTDSGSVLRKGDDLSTKIDTSRKIAVAPEKNKPAPGKSDPAIKTQPDISESPGNPAPNLDISTGSVKDNNKIWKEFVESVISTLNTEVLTSKKIKKGDYTVMADYVIGLEGEVTITNVYLSPESKFLEEQVRERLGIDTPKLTPVTGSNGKARKVNKRYTFTLTRK